MKKTKKYKDHIMLGRDEVTEKNLNKIIKPKNRKHENEN